MQLTTVTVAILSGWWLVPPWLGTAISAFVCFYHWNEMIGELNARLPEADQIPYGFADFIGQKGKFFSLMERGSIMNILRLHEKAFPGSFRGRSLKLGLCAWAFCRFVAVIAFWVIALF